MIYTNERNFAAILQLRPARADIVEFVFDELKRKGDVFITKEVSLKTGVDLYLTSSSFAKSLGERLKRKFKGKITLSRSLYGYNREKSKEVYRLTVCFRLKK